MSKRTLLNIAYDIEAYINVLGDSIHTPLDYSKIVIDKDESGVERVIMKKYNSDKILLVYENDLSLIESHLIVDRDKGYEQRPIIREWLENFAKRQDLGKKCKKCGGLFTHDEVSDEGLCVECHYGYDNEYVQRGVE